MLWAPALELRNTDPGGTVTVIGSLLALGAFLTFSLMESPLLAPVPLKVYSTFPAVAADCSVTAGIGGRLARKVDRHEQGDHESNKLLFEVHREILLLSSTRFRPRPCRRVSDS